MTAARRPVWWEEFPTAAFHDLDPMRTVAVLPLAAVEQHGPHLPVGTDAFINRGLLDVLIDKLPADLDLRILPVQSVGKSNEHLHAPGTLTLPPSVLIEAWTEIGLSVARVGIRKLVMLNSHGGNEEVIGIVARELRVRAGMLVVKTSWSRFGNPDGLLSDNEKRHGIHGGDSETSLMLHLRETLVDMTKAEDFISVAARDEQRFALLRPTGTHAYAWIASDLNNKGTVGNAANATPARGQAIADHQTDGLIQLLQDVVRAELPADPRYQS